MKNIVDIRKQQSLALFLWRKYSIAFDRINRNPLLAKFARDNKDAPEYHNRVLLWQFLAEEFLNGTPIDYLEFGVFKGDSIRMWIDLNKSQKSRFYGFDTFTGLPENWFKGFDKNSFSVEGEIPKIEDNRVSFIRGLFQDTLPNFLKSYERKNRLVVHIDADLYSSSLFVLVSMRHVFQTGDIIIFDDFLDPMGEFKAFQDYCQTFRTSPKLLATVRFRRLVDKAAFIV